MQHDRRRALPQLGAEVTGAGQQPGVDARGGLVERLHPGGQVAPLASNHGAGPQSSHRPRQVGGELRVVLAVRPALAQLESVDSLQFEQAQVVVPAAQFHGTYAWHRR